MESETFPNGVANLLGGLIPFADKMDLPKAQTKSSNKQERTATFP